MSATNDLQSGIRTAWAANGTLNGLLPSTRLSDGSQGGAPAVPYANVKIEKGGEPEQVSTGGGIVHKKVTFTIMGATAASVAAVVDAAQTLFSANVSVPNSTMSSWLYDEDESDESPQKKDGAQLYEGKLVYAVMLGRASL